MTRRRPVETAIYDLETQLGIVLIKKCRKKRMKMSVNYTKDNFHTRHLSLVHNAGN